MPFPKDHIQGQTDCFRCSLAYILDLHPSRVKFIAPYSGGDRNMYELYDEYLQERFDLNLLWFSKPEAIDVFLCNPKNWIAVVPPLAYQSDYHAVVMNGNKLIYDPNGPMGRKQKPKKIGHAVVVVDHLHEDEDGSISFVY